MTHSRHIATFALGMLLGLLSLPTQLFASFDVGTPAGNLSVSPTGAAAYSVAIEVPKGIGGMEPRIGIAYNSQSGNGVVGWGCSISGLSAITVAPRDIYHDGAARGLRYDLNDAYCLDGQRLIEESPRVEGCDSVVFHPEGNPYTRVVMHDLSVNAQYSTWFSVETPDGMKYEYGGVSSATSYFYSYSLGRMCVSSWLVHEAESPSGHTISYWYERNGYTTYPSYIYYGVYGSRSYVRFSYESRPDTIVSSVQGNTIFQSRRLKTVTSTTETGGTEHTYRRYELSYNQTGDGTPVKYSRLSSVTMYNGSGDYMRPLQLQWNFLPGYVSDKQQPVFSPNIYSNGCTLGDMSFFSADFNGDGLSDIAKLGCMRYDGTVLNNYVHIYHAVVNASGLLSFSLGSNIEIPSSIIEDGWCSVYSSPAAADVDGDGVNELLIPDFTNLYGDMKYFGIRAYRGSSFYGGVAYYGVHTSDAGGILWSPADFDNDGHTEFAVVEKEATGGIYHGCVMGILSGSTAFCQLFGFSLPREPRHIQTADADGDGLPDIVVFYDYGYSVFLNDGSWLNHVKLWDDAGLQTPVTPAAHAYATSLVPSNVWQGDFNGDGSPDFLLAPHDDGNLYLALGRGDGSFTVSTGASLPVYEQQSMGEDDDKLSCHVADFNGDGLSDVVMTKTMYYRNASGHLYFRTYTYWLFSDGHRLNVFKSASSLRPDDGLYRLHLAGDFNGDGLCDVANLGYDCQDGVVADADPVFRVYCNGSHTAGSGRVACITDGLGNTSDISYRPMTDGTVYAKGSDSTVFPVVNVAAPLPVVSSVTTGNGAAGSMTELYHYEGLKLHAQGLGLLGMTATTVTCPAMGTTSEKRVGKWHHKTFRPVTITATATLGGSTASTTTADTLTLHGGEYVLTFRDVVSNDFDGNTTLAKYWYDADNNGVLFSSVVNDEDWSLPSTYSLTRIGRQCLPDRVEENRWRGDAVLGEHRHVTTYGYDSRGRVLTRTDDVGTDAELTTTYTYNVWGDLTQTATTGAGAETVTKTYQWDPSHRFVTRSVERGYIVREYTYDLWGNVLTEIDKTRPACPDTTTYTYDGWGRLLTKRSPTGVVATYQTGWGTTQAQCYYTREQTTGQPWVKTWYDARGREVYSETVGNGLVSVGTATSYDSRARVSQRQHHHGSLSWTETLTYDGRDRVLAATTSPGPQTTYSYGNRSVTATTAGRSRTIVRDSRDNIVQATDPAGTVVYEYAPNGLPWTVSSGGATVTMEYDEAARRTGLTDPDAGTMAYTYDALGRITSQTDARGYTTQNTYDSRGQLVQTACGSQITTYTYGTGPTDNALLLSEQTADSCQTAYTYDVHGRVTVETRHFPDGTQLSYAYTYNDKDQLSQVVLPGGLTVSYLYDSYGYCFLMTADNKIVYYEKTTDGRRDSLVLSGGISLSQQRDSCGYLQCKTWYRNGSTLRNYAFSFDAQTGDLLWRQLEFRRPGLVMDSLIQVGPIDLPSAGTNSHLFPGNDPLPTLYDFKECFAYDAADRLISTNASGSASPDVTYGPDGNILSKTGVGSYGYDSDRPHAVTSVSNPHGLVSSATLYTLFNGQGKVSAIIQDSLETVLTYGPDGQRWKSVLSVGGQPRRTIHYGGDYERVEEDGIVREFWYLGHDIIGMRTDGGGFTFLVAITDHQGSITNLVNSSGDIVFSQDYDAWGKPTLQKNDIGFQRGYTGHEMLPEYGLINMNGRMYDPLLGRFLSPDNFVQQPNNSQNFNRYSYCLNNPLKYVDKDGNFFWIPVIAGALLGGVVNLGIQSQSGNVNNLWQGIKAFVVGAAAGGSGGAVGMAVSTSISGITGGFISGFFSSAASSAVEMGMLSWGNHFALGTENMSFNDFMGGVALSAIVGGTWDGIYSTLHKRNFFTGKSFMRKPYDIVPLTDYAVPISQDAGISAPSLQDVPVISQVSPEQVLQQTIQSPTFPSGTGNMSVYVGRDSQKTIRYAGITNNPGRRFIEHQHSNTPRSVLDFQVLPEASNFTLIQSRIIEQNLINTYRLNKYGGDLFNKINSIAPRYWDKYGIGITFILKF